MLGWIMKLRDDCGLIVVSSFCLLVCIWLLVDTDRGLGLRKYLSIDSLTINHPFWMTGSGVGTQA